MSKFYGYRIIGPSLKLQYVRASPMIALNGFNTNMLGCSLGSSLCWIEAQIRPM